MIPCFCTEYQVTRTKTCPVQVTIIVARLLRRDSRSELEAAYEDA